MHLASQKRLLHLSHLRVLLLATLAVPAAYAQTGQAAAPADLDTPAMYLQYGFIQRGSYEITAGLTLPWQQQTLGFKELSLHWDVGLSRWSATTQQGRRNTQVLGIKPVLRWRGDQGQSRWFYEAGVGVSYALNRRYETRDRYFSTRFNFASHVGVGHLFGARYQHEAVLRIEHHSNARIKHPNPGENFLQLRYAAHF